MTMEEQHETAADLAEFGCELSTTFSGRTKMKCAADTTLVLLSVEGVQVALLTDSDSMLIYFLGTNEFRDWAINLNASVVRSIDCDVVGGGSACGVHGGFMGGLDLVRAPILAFVSTQLKHKQRLFIAGHSMGGALAVLTGMMLCEHSPEVFTFGAPRVGNRAFAKLFRSLPITHHRYETTGDIVPHTPPAVLGFKHTGRLMYLTEARVCYRVPWLDRLVQGVWSCFSHGFDGIEHSLYNYRELLKKHAESQGRDSGVAQVRAEDTPEDERSGPEDHR